MDITAGDLGAEFDRAQAEWGPIIAAAEAKYGLPRFALYAIGSRETNLRNVVSRLQAGGHRGHGVWQLDSPSHVIPAGFDQSVTKQAAVAASMLRSGHERFASAADPWRCSFAAYNAGRGTVDYDLKHGLSVDHGTAGGNYSADVKERMEWLQENKQTSEGDPMALTPDDIENVANAVITKLLEYSITTKPTQAGPVVTSTFEGFVTGAERHAAVAHEIAARIEASMKHA